MTVNQFMTQDHRSCDEEFAELENLVDSGDFSKAEELFKEFKEHMEHHFTMEEKVMFPEFNTCSGGGCNPTTVMIMEHEQMRTLFAQMEEALVKKDKNQFLGTSENLLFVMQQHNMKEEQIMYNLVDNSLNSEEIIEKMKVL